MQSANNQINQLHAVYCSATGMQLGLLPASERWWFDAIQSGMTDNDIALVVKSRQQRVKQGLRRRECLLLRNFIGSDEAIQSVMEEAIQIRALQRDPKFSKGKQEVLKCTGRPTEPDLKGIRTIGEVLDAMRKAAK